MCLKKKALCERYGFLGYIPQVASVPPRAQQSVTRPVKPAAPVKPPSLTRAGEKAARSAKPGAKSATAPKTITPPKTSSPDRTAYLENMQALRKADILIANLTPFRGVSAHVGAAFEVGVFAALAKPVFAYAHGHKSQVIRMASAGLVASGLQPPRAVDGMFIEDLGLPESYMLARGCVGEILTPETPELTDAAAVGDLKLFEACLKQATVAMGLGETDAAKPRTATPA